MIVKIICANTVCKERQLSHSTRTRDTVKEAVFKRLGNSVRKARFLEGLVIRGGLEGYGQYLVIKGARGEEAQKEIESWLRKIKMLQ